MFPVHEVGVMDILIMDLGFRRYIGPNSARASGESTNAKAESKARIEGPRSRITGDSEVGGTSSAQQQRKVGGSEGLEPAASCVTARRSNQLNYAPALKTDSLLSNVAGILLPAITAYSSSCPSIPKTS